jgi:hypothetical protein
MVKAFHYSESLQTSKIRTPSITGLRRIGFGTQLIHIWDIEGQF